jgi:hypothetical protein
MNLKLKIFRIAKTSLLMLLVTSVFTFSMNGQLAADNMSEDLKTLDKLIRDIRWNTHSDYLLYHNVSIPSSEMEENLNVEIWMIDLCCWNSEESEELNQLLCVQEFEYDYPVEDWMLETFNTNVKSDTADVNEDVYPVEEWMYDLKKFNGVN